MSDLAKTGWVKWFAQFVLSEKNLNDWETVFLDFDDGSSCSNEFKRIEISGLRSDSWYYLKEIILHEVAHALAPDRNIGKTSATSHDSEFFKRYGELLVQFSEIQPPKGEQG